ncbi:putative alcohol dehydrogenase [Diplodia seriata]|uniref:Putative alcohol dehydrogenase n=1 Tax=Diplodia seriata TaxID=420778 RepID=A0A0G2FMY9_9PEZI|nr:putative alcohol dehydrogenase [Diplodia seriata]
MSNKAAVVEQIGSPVVIKTVERYTPGPDEILVKNKVINFTPLAAKMQKFAPIPYKPPVILGFSSAGIVETVGANVTYVKPGDRVAVLTVFDLSDRHGHFQEYYIANPQFTSKIPDGVSLEDASSVPANLATVVAVMQALHGPERPSPDGKKAAPNGKKLLVYGGSSSVGGYAVKYGADLGYDVVTTSSPANRDYVASLGAGSVVDHRQPAEKVVADLKALGPFDGVVDTIGTAEQTAILGQVLAEQKDDITIFTMLPEVGDAAAYATPAHVKRVYQSWPQVLEAPEKKDVLEWTYHVYIPEGLASGAIIPTRNEEMPGGIDGIQAILDKSLEGGVSGKRLITLV